MVPALNLETAFYNSGKGTIDVPYIPSTDVAASKAKTVPTTSTIKVVSNTKELLLSSVPYMNNNIPMLPVQEALKASGAKVVISGSKLTITFRSKKVEITVNSSTGKFNGKNSALEAKVVSQNNVVYAPLKRVVEALGGSYNWDAKKKLLIIKLT